MAFTFRDAGGSDASLDRDSLSVVRKYEVMGTLPYTGGGDAFDVVSSAVMGYVVTSPYATYGTPFGVLYWNSIQLHEDVYAQKYSISIVYSPVNRQSGTYQISVDQGVGTAKCMAGVWQATYAVAANDKNKCHTFWDGRENKGIDVPCNEDKITVMFRHPQAYLNRAYIRAIGKLRGYPCSDSFLGYDAGEVTYMGGQFAESNTEASASYAFVISPNVTNLVIGEITVTEKKGFDVASPMYEWGPETNGASKVHATQKLKCINVIRPQPWKAYQSVFGWGG